MFLLLIAVYGLIFFISIFGNTKERELEKEKQDWKRIIGEDYK